MRAEFRLHKPVANATVTVDQALQRAAKDFGIEPAALAPELVNPHTYPHDVGYVWKWYACDLRPSEALTFAEIQAWADLTDTPVLGCEAQLLIDIDRVKWSVYNERHSRLTNTR